VDLGLKGRTALICGASSGLGLASAEALSAEGANVTMFARTRDTLEREANRLGALAVRGDVTLPQDLERAVAQTIEAFGGLDILVWNSGGPPAGTGIDVTLPQDLERAVAQTLEAFGGLDILVWNSGGPPAGKATDVTADSVEQAFELLLQPAVRLVQLGLPHLERSGNGRIIAITSLAAKEPTQHLALSNMLRPGLTGYLKTLSAELGPQAITVNCVAPGRIDTDRLAHLYPDGPTEEQLAEIPLRRWGTPREFGDVVCFVASDRARYLTGQTIVVDGGLQKFLF
jgi:3-oxoacyl-[acyl-carrier protein] reductase